MSNQSPHTSPYPPYACSCCGYTNGDMFQDWLGDREPTARESIDFEVTRRTFEETGYLKRFKQELEGFVYDRRAKKLRKPRRSHVN